MISEVHVAYLMQRAAAGDCNQPIYPGGIGEGENTAVTADDVVAWGTSGGAKVPGLGAIALYPLDDLRYFGLKNMAVGPVASGGRPMLKGLWTNGLQVVSNDVLQGMDVWELRSESSRTVRRLKAG